MYTIQASDCEGTALTTAVTGKTIEQFGTVIARLRELKTGWTPDGGQRNRILTFVVQGPQGVTTYTRVRGGGVIDDETGIPLPGEEGVGPACYLCGAHEKPRGGYIRTYRHRTVTGLVVRLCKDCSEAEPTMTAA